MFTKYCFYPLFFIMIIGCHAVFAQQKQITFTGYVTYLDPRLEKLIPKDAKIEVIGSGFQHIEAPVWVPDSNMLLFSDTKARVIYRWQEEKGISKFLSNAGFTGRLPYSEEPGPNGLALTKNGNLLICEHGDRRIAAFAMNGKYGLVTVSDQYKNKRYNSPNDVIIKSDGSIYFTDPPYGLPLKENDPTKQTPFNGVYRLDNGGRSQLIIADLKYPNGLAFSPDEKRLYISVSNQQNPHLMVYPIANNGSVGKAKLFFDASGLPKEQEKEVTDGFKIDHQENIWTSAPGGLLIIDKSGKLLGKISTGEVISNCCFNKNGTVLFITAGSFLYRLKINLQE